mgnify:CR=1 FL=1
MNRSDERKEVGAGMARTRGEAHRGEERIEHEDSTSQEGDEHDEVRGGRGIMREHVEAEMWQELRDALLLEPGTATSQGVGDPNA